MKNLKQFIINKIYTFQTDWLDENGIISEYTGDFYRDDYTCGFEYGQEKMYDFIDNEYHLEFFESLKINWEKWSDKIFEKNEYKIKKKFWKNILKIEERDLYAKN